MSDGSETLRHNTSPTSELLLIPRFKTLRPRQLESIAILNRSANQMIITLDSEAPQDIVSLSFDPSTITLAPNRQMEAEIRAVRTNALAYPEGLTFEAHLRAYTSDGAQGLATITIELRPRYEWLASLLLLFGCAGAALVGLLLLTLSRPAQSPTTAAVLPTTTATFLPTYTPIPAVIVTVTMPPPTVVPQQSCEDKRWHRYIVEAGDSLEGVLQPRESKLTEEVAVFNNLPLNRHIIEGQELCLPQIYKAKLVSLTVDASPVCGMPFNAYVTIKNVGTITWNKTVHVTSFANGAQVFARDYPISIPIGQPVTIPLSMSITNGYNQNQNLTLSAKVTGQAEQKVTSGFFLNCPHVQADFTFEGFVGGQEIRMNDGLYTRLISSLTDQSANVTRLEWSVRLEDALGYGGAAFIGNYEGSSVSINEIVPYWETYMRVTITLLAYGYQGDTDTCVKVYEQPYGGGTTDLLFVSQDCAK